MKTAKRSLGASLFALMMLATVFTLAAATLSLRTAWAETSSVSVKYREANPSVLDSNGNVVTDNYVMYAMMPDKVTKVDDYEVSVSKDGESDTTIYTKNVRRNWSGSYLYWLAGLNKDCTEGLKEGSYTVTIKKKDSSGSFVDYASGSFKLKEVIFNVGNDGSFDDNQDGKYTGYGMVGESLNGFHYPKISSNAEDKTFLGWSEKNWRFLIQRSYPRPIVDR